ncbi:hypothetical protein DMENIID0001_083140 [Sergentomyia squamirostris]
MSPKIVCPIWKKIQANFELLQKYEKDHDFIRDIHILKSLAFLPVDDVFAAYEDILNRHFQCRGENKAVQDFLDYFEYTWVGNRRRGKPLYPIGLWNCHNAILDDLPKTSNNVEGWHNGFFNMVGKAHPTVWTLINMMRLQ